jgi:hypothetical protein
MWDETYNILRDIQPLLIPLGIVLTIIILLFGNNLLSKITRIKFSSYSGGVIFRHSQFQNSSTWLLFYIPINVKSNYDTEIINTELRYKNKWRKTFKLLNTKSIDGNVSLPPKHNFRILKNTITTDQNLLYIFGGKLSEKYYSEVENLYKNNAKNNNFEYVKCYMRLHYLKNGKDKKTRFKKFLFYPNLNRVWFNAMDIRILMDDGRLIDC